MDQPQESTLVMGEPEREKARQLTLSRLRPPRRIPGYEQEKFLGRGAFGEVWVAVNSNTGRKVAIKFYHRRGGLDWSLLSREVEKLRHLFADRHVVQLLEVGWESDPPYYVMEYMENGSLEDLLRNGPVPVDQALPLLRGIAQGLVHAHGKGILHCDLKPANVMIDQDGQPRLADFGQSRLSHEHTPALGTLFYMAPEQADLKASPDARWDVYAFGAVMYRMFTESPPFRSQENLNEVQQPGPLDERLTRYRRLLASAPKPDAHRGVPGVDAALAAIIDKCLSIDPKHRYPNIQSVLSALDARAAQRARRPLLVLGGIGPLLVLFIILGVAGYESLRMIRMTEQEEKAKAQDVNRLAAKAEADRIGWEVAVRWQILQQEASSLALRSGLANAGKAAAGDAIQRSQWLVERQEQWGARGGPALQGTNWVVLDRSGYIRGCTEPDPNRPGKCRVMTGVLGLYFGFRDYFHGRGQDMPVTDRAPQNGPPQPITHPHRSAVFRQRPQNTFAVAFSTPIQSPSAADPNPIGVLVLISDLVGSTRLQAMDGRDRFVVLVDTGRDELGRRGLIVRHPYQDDFTNRPTDLPLVFGPELIEKQDGYAGEYSDPVGREDWGRKFAVPWIAAIEPVRVPIAPEPGASNESRDTGWVVVVQEAENEVLGPIRTLQTRLATRAALTILLIALLLGGLWLFVLVVMDAAPGSQVVRFLRRKIGLKSATSITSGGGSGSGGDSITSHRSGTPSTPGEVAGHGRTDRSG